MADLVEITPLNWPLFTELAGERERTRDVETLAAMLARPRYVTSGSLRTQYEAARTIASYPEAELALLGLRSGLSEYALPVARQLLSDEPRAAELRLATLCEASFRIELAAPHYLLLAMVSESYREGVVRAKGARSDFVWTYDGDPVIAEAIGGTPPPGRSSVALHDPASVIRIRDGLVIIHASSYPRGQAGPLRDFYERFMSMGRTLEAVFEEDVETLGYAYRSAAEAGHGIRART